MCDTIKTNEKGKNKMNRYDSKGRLDPLGDFVELHEYASERNENDRLTRELADSKLQINLDQQQISWLLRELGEMTRQRDECADHAAANLRYKAELDRMRGRIAEWAEHPELGLASQLGFELRQEAVKG